MMKCLCVMFLLILPSPCQADDIYIMMRCMCVCYVERHVLSSPAPSGPLFLVRARATFHYTFLFKPLHFQHQNDDEDCQDYNDRLRSANIYCFRAELSAEGAKRGVETPPEVFPPDDLPRPSRPKAGLGQVMIMIMIVKVIIT